MINKDIRILSYEPLATPDQLGALYPITEDNLIRVQKSRDTVNSIIKGTDRRLLAIVGPCSIHDHDAALEYAHRLRELADRVSSTMYVVMRTYFEKPRTVGGWKGLILDPRMDGSYDIEYGLSLARRILIEITELGLPVGCEVLDPVIPQYIDELISWASIGARTTESQTHRNLASGLSVAVGFKNSTNGAMLNAVNAIRSARLGASFIGIDRDGTNVVIRTSGNDCGHLILRGGDNSPNYYEDDIERASRMMEENGLEPSIIVDCSHGNSRKMYQRQKRVLRSITEQILMGEKSIKGFMLESNLFEGRQNILDDKSCMQYGVSVTDGCIGWDETEKLLLKVDELLRSKDRYSEFDIL